MLWPGAAEALRGADRHLIVRHVARLRHALRTQGFDALIVTVAGAAAVADLTEPARRGFQGHHGAVHIARGGDRRIDVTGRHGADLHGLFAEQPARHVEVVNHHILKQTARCAHIVDRGRARVAAGDREHFQPADGRPIDGLFQRGELRIEAPVKPQRANHTGGLDEGPAAFGPGQVEIERFFAKNRFARPGAAFDQFGMSSGRTGDNHRVDLRVRQGLVGAGDGRAVPIGQPLCRGLTDIDDILYLHGGVLRGRGGVYGADAAGAKDTDPDHGRLRGLAIVCRSVFWPVHDNPINIFFNP